MGTRVKIVDVIPQVPKSSHWPPPPPLPGKVRGMVYDVTSNDYVFGNIKTHFLP